MHAYLIICRDIELLEEKIQHISSKLGSKTVPFELKKIADIKELSKFTNLDLDEKTSIVIKNINKATRETQNAFLKSLEEPQKKLSYILTTDSEESVLPTIISRCQIVEVQSKKVKLPKDELDKLSEFINSTTGEKLKITSKITKREDALEFTKKLAVALESKIQENTSVASSLENILEAYTKIKANGNVQLQLTNLVIRLKSLHI